MNKLIVALIFATSSVTYAEAQPFLESGTAVADYAGGSNDDSATSQARENAKALADAQCSGEALVTREWTEKRVRISWAAFEITETNSFVCK